MDIKVFQQVQKRGHEQVTFFYYPEVGLRAVVAIHNTALGPALGGCRMRLYQNEDQAIDDALRLSEGMTYKSALAGLDLGGGKSCILADPSMTEGRREMLLQFGQCLNHLGGRYITAEDMGTSVQDVMVMREVTKHAAGFAPEQGGGGDPSPWTAKGVFRGMQAALEHRYGSKELKGKKVALQGVGHVGEVLLALLREAGAEVMVTDTNKRLLEEVARKHGAKAVDPQAIYDLDCEVYAPCAVGQTVNAETLPRLKCQIIAGAANNQLSDASVYKTILDRKMLYCPDFAINSGGVISVGGEYIPGGWKESWVAQKVENIYNTIHKVLEVSEQQKKFPEIVALELAKARIESAQQRGK